MCKVLVSRQAILNVPNLRFPEFSGEWMSCQLGKIASLSKGEGISKDQRSINGNPCILYGELYTTYSTEIIDEVISKTNLPEKGLVKSKANDVIIPASGETAIDISTARCVTRSDVFLGGDLNIIRLKGQDGKFFSYQLNGVRKKDIAKVAQGVSIVHLHGSDLATVQVNYPSIGEQQKISGFLSLIDQRIAIQNRLIEKYESLIKAIIDKWVKVLLSGKTVRFDQLYERAGEGGTPSTSVKEYYDGGEIPFVKIEDLSPMYLTENKDYITAEGLSKSSAWMIPEHSVIYSNGATIGSISINTYPVTTKQGILGIVPLKGVQTEYLYYMMRSSYFSKEVHRIITEGTMKTAYLKDINSIICPIPFPEIQSRMVSGLLALSEKVSLEGKIQRFLKDLKSTLLNQLFI